MGYGILLILLLVFVLLWAAAYHFFSGSRIARVAPLLAMMVALFHPLDPTYLSDSWLFLVILISTLILLEWTVARWPR